MFDTASSTELWLRIFGIYFIAAGLGFALNGNLLTKIAEELRDQVMIRFISGFLAFGVGVLILATHNTVGHWTSYLVTAFGWISLIKGLILFIRPQISLGTMDFFLAHEGLMRIYMIVIIVIGAGLLFVSFS